VTGDIVRTEVHMNTCLILNGFLQRSVQSSEKKGR